MTQVEMQQNTEDEMPSYPETHDLRWLADTGFKIEKLREYIQGNVEFNKLHGRTETDLSYQMNTIFSLEEIECDLDEDIANEVMSHPAYPWLSGIKGIDEHYVGKILGSIRFWPPKKNATNEGTGKHRYAHTRGALLTYCGLGNNTATTKNPNSSKMRESNQKLNQYIFKQIDSLLAAKSHYHTYFQAELSASLTQHVDSGYKINEYVNEQLAQRARKATAILFLCHIYETVKLAINPEIGRESIQPIQNIDVFYNDPMNMVEKI